MKKTLIPSQWIVPGQYHILFKDNLSEREKENHFQWVSDLISERDKHNEALFGRRGRPVPSHYRSNFEKRLSDSGYSGTFEDEVILQIAESPDVSC